jgi:hypothetical protein
MNPSAAVNYSNPNQATPGAGTPGVPTANTSQSNPLASAYGSGSSSTTPYSSSAISPTSTNTGSSLSIPGTSSVPGASNLPSLSSVYGNLNFPTSVNDIGGSQANEANTLAGGVDQALASYNNTVGSLQNPLTTYQNLLQQNGIPQLQQTSEGLQGEVNGLNEAISRVTPNVWANTTNSLVTADQQQNMEQNQTTPLETAVTPLTSQLATIENSLGTQEQNVSGEVSAQENYNSMITQAAGMGVSVAQANAAMIQTGFGADESNTLNMLLTKLNAQQNLDNNDWQTLSTLATNQQQYLNALGQISATANASNTELGNEYMSNGNTITNLKTGQIENPSVLGANGSYTPPA